MKTIKTYLAVLLASLGLMQSANATAVASPIMGTIYMVTLHTNNFKQMKAFYQDTLQLKVVYEKGEFVEFASKGVRLSLASYKALSFLPSDSLKGAKQGSGVGIGFKYATSKAVDDAYQALIKNGAQPVSAPTAQAWGEYTAFFADPDGNVHELVSDIK